MKLIYIVLKVFQDCMLSISQAILAAFTRRPILFVLIIFFPSIKYFFENVLQTRVLLGGIVDIQ